MSTYCHGLYVAGTMSGGGTKVAKGRMCSSFVSDVTPQHLAEMEKKLEVNEKATEVNTERDGMGGKQHVMYE